MQEGFRKGCDICGDDPSKGYLSGYTHLQNLTVHFDSLQYIDILG